MNRVYQAIQAYLKDLKGAHALAKNTIEAYRNDLYQWSYWLRHRHISLISQIDSQTLRKYLTWLKQQGHPNSSLLRFISSVKQFYEFLIKKHVAKFDPSLEIRQINYQQSQPLFFNWHELKILFSNPSLGTGVGQRDRTIFELMFASGLRASEVIRLRITEVNLKRQLLRINGKISRVVPFDVSAKLALKRYLRAGRADLNPQPDQDFVFLNQHGQPLTRQGLWLIVKRNVKNAGLNANLSLGTFRNTFAKVLLENGASFAAVRKLLGVTSDSMLKKIQRVIEKAK